MDESRRREAVAFAEHGNNVALVSDDLTASEAVFQEILEDSPSGIHKVRRTNGNQSITFTSGGRLHFLSVRSSRGRGMTLDRAYVPAAIGHEAMEQIAPAVNSTGGAIVGYF